MRVNFEHMANRMGESQRTYLEIRRDVREVWWPVHPTCGLLIVQTHVIYVHTHVSSFDARYQFCISSSNTIGEYPAHSLSVADFTDSAHHRLTRRHVDRFTFHCFERLIAHIDNLLGLVVLLRRRRQESGVRG